MSEERRKILKQMAQEGQDAGLVEHGTRTDENGVTGTLYGPSGSESPFRNPVHTITDQCSCPMPGDHSVEELDEAYPGLYAKMLPEVYPRIDGPHLILGPECFTGDGDEVPQDVISWRGENYYRRTE